MTDSTIDIIRQVAQLARLEVTSTEADHFARQFERTLAQFNVLTKINVDNIDPMISASPRADILRDDTPTPSLAPDRILQNAPARVDDFYSVPKTVGGAE